MNVSSYGKHKCDSEDCSAFDILCGRVCTDSSSNGQCVCHLCASAAHDYCSALSYNAGIRILPSPRFGFLSGIGSLETSNKTP